MSQENTSKNFLSNLRNELSELNATDSDWFSLYEDADAVTADRSTLDHLFLTAPSEFAKGLITGIMVFRQQLSIITDRKF